MPSLKAAFEGDLQPQQILRKLSVLANTSIERADLLFFDEIQDCPEAVTSLKYFSEDLAEQAVVAAGSHLGLLRNESAFPVGKVEFLALHPLTYFEFLDNMEPQTHDFLNGQPLLSETPVEEFYHQRALHWFRLYLSVGGLPEAVKVFASTLKATQGNEHAAVSASRQVHERLIEGYRADFSKYSGVLNANHILRVFDSVALQLGQALDESVSKFKFSRIIPKKKGFESIEGPLSWLERSRLVIKTHISNRFEQPIKAFTQQNYFKAYLFDVGILNVLLGTPVENLLLASPGIFKGFLAENFVAQELFASLDQPLTGWSEGDSEIEFVVSRDGHLCPLEVKASSRARRSKSLDALIARYHPKLSIKLTGQNRSFSSNQKVFTLPIYLAGRALRHS